MQGIRLSFDPTSVEKLKSDFDKIIKDLQNKASININLNKVNEQIKNLEAQVKNATGKMKVFDENQINQDKIKVFKSIEEIKKAYESMGEVNFSSIFKDANENVTGIVMQLKQADGIVKNIKFDKINIASNGTVLDTGFTVGSIKDIDKTSEIAEKQAQKIQAINKKITTEQEKETAKQKQDREDYVNWWIEQENKLAEAMAKGNEKSILASRQQVNDEAIKQAKASNKGLEEEQEIRGKVNNVINETIINRRKENEELEKAQAKAINKSLEDEYQAKLNEQKRIAGLGEFRQVVDPDIFNRSNAEIKEYIQGIYGLDAKIVAFKRSVDNTGNSVVKFTVNTKNNRNEIIQEKAVIDNATKSIYKQEEALKANTSRMVGFTDRLKNAFVAVASFASVTTVFYQALHKVQEGIDIINKLNKSQVNIQMIAGYTRTEIQGMTKDYSNLADQLYTTTDAIMLGAEEFLRSGKNIEETNSLLKASTIGGAVSGQSNQEMAEQLIAISNGFKMATNDAKQMMDVIDTLSTLDNNSATSMKEISTAITRTASSAQMAGVSFKDLSTYIATVSSVNSCRLI